MKYRGIVDWFDIEKGFGFVKSDSFDLLISIHFAAIETDGFKYLNPGDEVEFDVVKGNRGWQVAKAKKIN